MSMDRQMGKESVVNTYTGILLSLEERGNPAICNHTDEPGGHDAQRSEPDIEGQILYDPTDVRI